MKIAFIIYNNITALDFIGVYDPVTRLKTMGFIPDLEWDVCSYTKKVCDKTKLIQLIPSKVKEPFYDYDVIIVSGGYGSRKLVDDDKFINWLKTAKNCKLKISVCTGALLLGAAGFLHNKRATTHRNAFKELEEHCLEVVDQRIVEDDDVISARGVTSSIDLGLYICKKLAGKQAAKKIREQMDYGGLSKNE